MMCRGDIAETVIVQLEHRAGCKRNNHFELNWHAVRTHLHSWPCEGDLLWIELGYNKHSDCRAGEAAPGYLQDTDAALNLGVCLVNKHSTPLVRQSLQQAERGSRKVGLCRLTHTFLDQCVHASSIENNTPPIGAPKAACTCANLTFSVDRFKDSEDITSGMVTVLIA